jgi:hypothetical protein
MMPIFPKNQIIRSRDETFGEAGADWDPGFGLKPQLDERRNRGVTNAVLLERGDFPGVLNLERPSKR